MAAGRTLHVRCATWEQVEIFHTRKLRRGKLLSMKVPFRAELGAQVTLGLELPNQVVIAIDGRVQKASPVEGEAIKTWIEIELIGFTEEVLGRIRAMMTGAELPEDPTPPPVSVPIPAAEGAPPADDSTGSAASGEAEAGGGAGGAPPEGVAAAPPPPELAADDGDGLAELAAAVADELAGLAAAPEAAPAVAAPPEDALAAAIRAATADEGALLAAIGDAAASPAESAAAAAEPAAVESSGPVMPAIDGFDGLAAALADLPLVDDLAILAEAPISDDLAVLSAHEPGVGLPRLPRADPLVSRELLADEHQLFMHLTTELRRLRQLAVHEVLGVDRDADADGIRLGWMRLVRSIHPDLVARHHSPAITHLAEELTILCNRAYDRLRAALVLEGRATSAGSVLQQPAGWLVGFDDISSRGASSRIPVITDAAAPPLPDALPAAPPPPEGTAPSVVQGGEAFESRARRMLSNGDADHAQEVLAAALCVYPRSRPLRSLYYVASALSALSKGERMLATSQLETALAHYEHCVEAAQILEYMRRHALADHVELRRFFR